MLGYAKLKARSLLVYNMSTKTGWGIAETRARNTITEGGGIVIEDHPSLKPGSLAVLCPLCHKVFCDPISNINRRKYLCSMCGSNAKLTIEEMHELAEDRGGECLSDKIVN
jgi:hypothetical protein